MDTDVKVHFGSRPVGLEQRIKNDSSTSASNGLYYSSIKCRKMQYSHGYLGDVTPVKIPP